MFYTQQHYRFLRMSLMVCDAHIIYFHMDAAKSVALGQSYFACLDYFGGPLSDLSHLVGSYHNKTGGGT